MYKTRGQNTGTRAINCKQQQLQRQRKPRRIRKAPLRTPNWPPPSMRTKLALKACGFSGRKEEKNTWKLLKRRWSHSTLKVRGSHDRRLYLCISGLFLGFIISFSAACLWYMVNRSFRVIPQDGKCWAGEEDGTEDSCYSCECLTSQLRLEHLAIAFHFDSDTLFKKITTWVIPLKMLAYSLELDSKSGLTFNVMNDGDNVLSKQLRWTSL